MLEPIMSRPEPAAWLSLEKIMQPARVLARIASFRDKTGAAAFSGEAPGLRESASGSALLVSGDGSRRKG